MKNLLIALFLITLAQTLAYFQLQSQFISEWAKKNTLFVALLGAPISILLIWFTKYCYIYFNNQVWPGRLIGFSVGAIVFAFLSHFYMYEKFTLKTSLCLGLAFLILIIQIFWKD